MSPARSGIATTELSVGHPMTDYSDLIDSQSGDTFEIRADLTDDSSGAGNQTVSFSFDQATTIEEATPNTACRCRPWDVSAHYQASSRGTA
jgi:hypothetical protein